MYKIFWFYFEGKIVFDNNNKINIIEAIQVQRFPDVFSRKHPVNVHFKFLAQNPVDFVNNGLMLFHGRLVYQLGSPFSDDQGRVCSTEAE